MAANGQNGAGRRTISYSDFINGQYVTIVVSSKGKTKSFFVLKNILCRYSNFVQVELQRRTRAAQARIIYLNNVTPDIFAHFNAWLHGNDLDLHYYMNKAAPGGLIQPYRASHLAYYCWLLAEKLESPRFGSHIITSLFALLRNASRPSAWALQQAWRHTKRRCGFQKLLIDAYALKVDHTESTLKLPRDLLAKVLEAMNNHRGGRADEAFARIDPSSYGIGIGGE